MKTKIYLRFTQTFVVWLLFTFAAIAQSGTLKGKVLDKTTKDPIPFASVVLEKGGKLVFGAAADFNGEFTIKPIPPGTYDLKASDVGHNTVIITNIVISPDRITYQDLSLEPKTTTLSCVQIMSYTVPLIDKDQTKTGQTLTSREISKMPGRDAGSLAITTGGTYSTSENTGNISIKGSRNDGVVTYIDGVKVLGGSNIPRSAIDQVNVLTGGLPASYGDATGGIINIIKGGPLYDEFKNNNSFNIDDFAPINIFDFTPVYTYSYNPICSYNDYNTESYDEIIENEFDKVSDSPLSTFSIDVDDASYSNMRRFIVQGIKPPPDAIRTEELINYFDYNYPSPTKEEPFAIYTEVATCPWNPKHQLVHIGIQGKRIETNKLPKSNLVFLIDVSGSMADENKLPLVKKSLRLLVNQMQNDDKIAIAVYASASGVVLNSTSCENKEKILAALEQLQAGGCTAGGEGIMLAYKIAKENYIPNGNNRVIIATDGDFNVGPSSDADMENLITEKRKEGVFLSVLGYGMGNYKDSKMEILADKGNGNYAYIDNLMEAQRVLVKEMGSTLYTIAKDVKIQVEFNPLNVKAYRLIGYEDRLLEDKDFNDDKKDAGELGAGSSVTALYEIITSNKELNNVPSIDSLKYQKTNIVINASTQKELMTVKIRYKNPKDSVSKLTSGVVYNNTTDFTNASDNFKFSAAVTEFSMLLRDSKFKGNSSYAALLKLANESKGADNDGYRIDFIKLAELASLIK
jgi:Ca-activated chloride channel homolog